jgi:hypothetical protein
LKGRCLAATARAQERIEFAALDFKAHAIYGLNFPSIRGENFPQALN